MFCLASCRQNQDVLSSSEIGLTPTDVNTDGKKDISLLYSYSDTLDPYTATTSANRQLALLLYDCLVKTDNNFNAHYILAQSVETVDKICTVKLREAVFTDGSRLVSIHHPIK